MVTSVRSVGASPGFGWRCTDRRWSALNASPLVQRAVERNRRGDQGHGRQRRRGVAARLLRRCGRRQPRHDTDEDQRDEVAGAHGAAPSPRRLPGGRARPCENQFSDERLDAVPPEILEGIAAGRVTLAFRRWRRAPPANSSSLRSPVGVLCLDRVTVVDEGDITPDDVRRTGMTIDELRASRRRRHAPANRASSRRR